MSKKFELAPEAFQFEGKMSLKEAIPLGMQHVLAMFVGNLTPAPDHYRRLWLIRW